MIGPRRWRLAPLVAMACVGCGGKKTPPPAPADEVVTGGWQEAANDRVVVAEVGGEPVFADCVEAQAAEHELTVSAALEACIDLELIAQEARRRGYLDDPEVIDARRREMARALIDEQFYARFASPDDIPRSDVKEIWDRGLKNYFNRAENRSTFYCRAINADAEGKTPMGGKADADAKTVADEIYRRVKNRSDLDPDSLLEICNQAAVDLESIATIASERFSFPRHGRAVEEFAIPTFGIARVGQVAPPARTPWGWDVILLTQILPERRSTLDEALAEARKMMFESKGFEGYRYQRFQKWIDGLVAAATTERFDENLPPSLATPTALGPAPPPTPSPARAP